jgi:hypothetical protein
MRTQHRRKFVTGEQDKDPSEDLAAWLKDAGRREWRAPGSSESNASDGATDSSEDLFRYLEELAGRELKTREDVRGYFDELSAKDREASRIHARRQVIKEAALLLGLVTAFIQYHLLDINLQISRLPSTVVFVPVETRSALPRSGAHESWDAADPVRQG